MESSLSGKIIADGRYFFPIERDEETTVFKDITTSVMNNHIGCSTIAFTKDHYVVFWTQNLAAQVSKDLLMPTGSGSVNASDFTENDLHKTLRLAMERELYEESSISSKKIGCQTQVIGFFRWLNRGGKPEFVGISQLDCSVQDLAPNNQEVKSDFEKSHLNREYIGSLADLEKMLKTMQQRENTSLSLYMSLLFLEEYLQHHPFELKSFLGVKK